MEDLSNVMSSNDLFSFKLFGATIPISDSIVTMWIVMLVIIILAYIFTRNLKAVPEGKQNYVEVIVEFINNFMKENIGHHWRHFAPYFGSLLVFLVLANICAIFSVIPTGEELYHLTGIQFFKKLPHYAIAPPTKDINVTVTLAIMTIIMVLGSAIRFKGISGWLKGLFKPSPIMLPFNLLDYGTRCLSLSLRLFGNILAAFIVMELIYGVFSPVLPIAISLYFDLFDGALQAYIFVFLSSVYIAEAIE